MHLILLCPQEGARTYGSTFEKTKTNQMFRVPFVTFLKNAGCAGALEVSLDSSCACQSLETSHGQLSGKHLGGAHVIPTLARLQCLQHSQKLFPIWFSEAFAKFRGHGNPAASHSTSKECMCNLRLRSSMSSMIELVHESSICSQATFQTS